VLGVRLLAGGDTQRISGVVPGAQATPDPVGAKGLDPKGSSVQRHLSLAGTDAYKRDRRASLPLSFQGRPPIDAHERRLDARGPTRSAADTTSICLANRAAPRTPSHSPERADPET
jgi:hypothetical protein